MTAELHLAENALALHLFLQRLESLVDIVIADENLHAASSLCFIRKSGDDEGPTKATPFSSKARMYQIEAGMSTCGRSFSKAGKPRFRDKFGSPGRDSGGFRKA